MTEEQTPAEAEGQAEPQVNGGPRIYSLAEVNEHNTLESCWTVIHNKVYDVTKFLDEVNHYLS